MTDPSSDRRGPLRGLRVVEVAGIGPAPFCAMVLADLGAEVVRVDRTGGVTQRPESGWGPDPLVRGRRSIGVDLKRPGGVEVLLRLIEGADVLVEGFRPGVAERLGFGPAACRERNPGLVYGRMTGWGQDGPLAESPGHDINYIALAGALAHVGRAGSPPTPPLNLVGDFGGGGMLLAVGILAALHEQRRSGLGQVVDAAMVDGAALLMAMFHGLRALGVWGDERGTNPLDSGAPFYDVYETADERFVAIGAVEPKFYDELLRRVGIDPGSVGFQLDKSAWPDLKDRLAAVFRTRTRDEWCSILEGTETCFAPVLTMDEAPEHLHNLARSTFVEVNGVVQPAPAPRFDRTPGMIANPPPHPGRDTDAVLSEVGYEPGEIAGLKADGAVA